MVVKFALDNKEMEVSFNINDKKHYTDWDDIIETQVNEDTFVAFFGIDEDTNVSSDVPCCIDVIHNGQYIPIYNFDVID